MAASKPDHEADQGGVLMHPIIYAVLAACYLVAAVCYILLIIG